MAHGVLYLREAVHIVVPIVDAERTARASVDAVRQPHEVEVPHEVVLVDGDDIVGSDRAVNPRFRDAVAAVVQVGRFDVVTDLRISYRTDHVHGRSEA